MKDAESLRQMWQTLLVRSMWPSQKALLDNLRADHFNFCRIKSTESPARVKVINIHLWDSFCWFSLWFSKWNTDHRLESGDWVRIQFDCLNSKNELSVQLEFGDVFNFPLSAIFDNSNWKTWNRFNQKTATTYKSCQRTIRRQNEEIKLVAMATVAGHITAKGVEWRKVASGLSSPPFQSTFLCVETFSFVAQSGRR